MKQQEIERENINLKEEIKDLKEMILSLQSSIRYQHEESGHIQFESGMVRDGSKDKPRFDLISPLGIPYEDQLLTRWARHMAKGATHYSERNWEKASGQEELNRFKESAYRHFMQWYYEEIDEDHAVSVWFNITGYELVKYKMNSNEKCK